MKTRKSIAHRLGVMAVALLALFGLANSASFEESIKSFHALTDAERAQANPFGIRTITAQSGTACAQLAKTTMPQLCRGAEQQLHLINGIYSSGELIKLLDTRTSGILAGNAIDRLGG